MLSTPTTKHTVSDGLSPVLPDLGKMPLRCPSQGGPSVTDLPACSVFHQVPTESALLGGGDSPGEGDRPQMQGLYLSFLACSLLEPSQGQGPLGEAA